MFAIEKHTPEYTASREWTHIRFVPDAKFRPVPDCRATALRAQYRISFGFMLWDAAALPSPSA